MNRLLSFFLLILIATSCSVNSDLMFKTPKKYEFDQPTDVTYDTYKLSPNDIITFYLYTNDGFMIIDLQAMGGLGPGTNARVNTNVKVNYLIEDYGYENCQLYDV